MSQLGFILSTQTAAVLLAVALTVSSETVVTVTGNPHAGQCDASVSATATSSSSQHGGGGIALGFSHLITPVSLVRTALATQTDTLFAFTTPRLLGAPTPVYAFRQSPRLPGSRELPFKILNVWTLLAGAEEELYELPAPTRDQALDSWFVGYAWSVVIARDAASGELVHLGWHFRAVDGTSAPFYSLIVDLAETERAASLHVGQRPATWMTVALLASMPARASK